MPLTRQHLPSPQSLIEDFVKLVQAETWPDTQVFLEEHPELLTPEATEVIRVWITSMDEAESWIYGYHYALLQACRLMGVSGAFDNFSPSTRPEGAVVVPARFAEEMDRLAELDEAARRDPRAHKDRIVVLKHIVDQLHDDGRSSLTGILLINVAQAYAQLPGDSVANLNMAREHLAQASRLFTQKTAPPEYAASQDSLGRAYARLATGDKAANTEKAIACFKEALRVLSPKYSPTEYAEVQNDLGITYGLSPSGDPAANLRRAIASFTEALLVLESQDAASQRADVEGNLSLAQRQLDLVLAESG